MWISRNEYDNMKANIKCLENRYYSQFKANGILADRLGERMHEVYELRDQLKQIENYKKEAEEYKQKYADEVNKRLELIKFYEDKSK